MMKSYAEELTLKTRDCDLTGAWRPGALLEAMQETATTHAELLGVGRHALLNQGLAWVVTRLELEMDRYPLLQQRVTVETWPMPMRRWFFPRYFVCRDEAGQEIGRAATLWVLLNLDSRQMARSESVAALMPDNRDLPAPLGLPAPVTEVSGTLQEGLIRPAYTDLDPNCHVNNARYADWACNALGAETLGRQELSHLVISFAHEVRPGDEIHTELRQLDGAFSFSGFRGDVRCFDVGGTLRPRQGGVAR